MLYNMETKPVQLAILKLCISTKLVTTFPNGEAFKTTDGGGEEGEKQNNANEETTTKNDGISSTSEPFNDNLFEPDESSLEDLKNILPDIEFTQLPSSFGLTMDLVSKIVFLSSVERAQFFIPYLKHVYHCTIIYPPRPINLHLHSL